MADEDVAVMHPREGSVSSVPPKFGIRVVGSGEQAVRVRVDGEFDLLTSPGFRRSSSPFARLGSMARISESAPLSHRSRKDRSS
jgi:hypothetical protein